MIIHKEYMVNNSKIEYEISSDEQIIEIRFFPDSLEEKAIFIDAQINNSYQFGSSIKIHDLSEKGQNIFPWKNERIWGNGFGTLVVNTFIELMRLIYFDGKYANLIIDGKCNKDILIRGSASISGSSEESFEKRKRFWSRFGFTFEDKSTGRFSAKLSDLSCVKGVTTTLTSSDISLISSIKGFWRPINRPLIKSYRKILEETCWEKFQERIDDAKKYQPPLSAISTYGVVDKISLLCSIIFSEKKYDQYVVLEKHRYLRSHAESIVNEIAKIEEEYPGFAYRVYEYWSRFSKNIAIKKYKEIAKFSKHKNISLLTDMYEEYIELMTITSNYFKQYGNFYNRDEFECAKYKDFLFGEIISNKIYISNLGNFSQILSEDLNGHIDRLLRNLSDNCLIVSSSNSSSAEFGEILKNIPDVHLVELYPFPSHNGGWYLYMKTFHESGVIDFHCDWEVYKDVRVNEMVSNAIYPLFSQKLNSKCYFTENGKKQFLSSNPRAFLEAVFDIVDLKDGICDKETKEIYVAKLQEILNSQKEKALE